MRFSAEQLRKIARWEPAVEPFADGDIVSRHIAPALRSLPDSHCHAVIECGDNANYIHAFVYPSLSSAELRESRHHRPVEMECVSVYLSLTVPIAAMGFTKGRVASNAVGANILDLDDIIDPSRPDAEILENVLAAFGDAPYQFVDQVYLASPLQDGISPTEFCLGREPWDRLFHVLFANSD